MIPVGATGQDDLNRRNTSLKMNHPVATLWSVFSSPVAVVRAVCASCSLRRGCRRNLWSLDVAAAVIPHLPELVKSKYER